MLPLGNTTDQQGNDRFIAATRGVNSAGFLARTTPLSRSRFTPDTLRTSSGDREN